MPVLPRLPRFQRAVDYFYLNWLDFAASRSRHVRRKFAPDRACTGTERDLSPLPLRWAMGAGKMVPSLGIAPSPTASEAVCSLMAYKGKW
jgi:hypothetical protein